MHVRVAVVLIVLSVSAGCDSDSRSPVSESSFTARATQASRDSVPVPTRSKRLSDLRIAFVDGSDFVTMNPVTGQTRHVEVPYDMKQRVLGADGRRASRFACERRLWDPRRESGFGRVVALLEVDTDPCDG